MIVAIAATEFYFESEQLAQTSGLQHFFFTSVSYDPAIRHEHHALDLGYDVWKFVSDQNNSNSRFSQSARGLWTSARAIKMRLASPDDISCTARSARCATPS